MSQYVKNATAEADAYEKKRKQQAAESIAQINANAAADVQAAVDDTGAAIREEQRTLLDTVDASAVERQVVRKQAKEAVANLGLTGSGLSVAQMTAADTADTRRTQTARRTRDEAVTALTEALTRREEAIESERSAAVLQETQDAEQDALEERGRLMREAYEAESTEKAAYIKAKQAQEKREQATATAAAKDAEKLRRTALKEMYQNQYISTEIYVDALEQGWTVAEARQYQLDWSLWRQLSGTFVETYNKKGYDAAIRKMAEHNITDRQLMDLCYELKLDPTKVRASLNAAKEEK